MSESFSLSDDVTYQDFLKRTDEYVASMLKDYDATGLSCKIIHDSVWGTLDFHEWEIQIIDSPLFQRLRNIGQVGLATLIYPSARHSRFEHPLGVVSIASRMMEALSKREASDDTETLKITEQDIYKVRFVALLHDIGHCFYSHISELAYDKYDEFYKLFDSIKQHKNGLKPKGHEIFSYLIINTPSFKFFF